MRVLSDILTKFIVNLEFNHEIILYDIHIIMDVLSGGRAMMGDPPPHELIPEYAFVYYLIMSSFSLGAH